MKTTATSAYLVEPARPDAAGAIHALMVAAFNPRYLSYTIYQAPQAAQQIRRTIEKGPADSGQVYRVIRERDRLVGYYTSVVPEEETLINYMAVATDRQGVGLGAALFSDFEARSRAGGSRAVTLYVFDDHHRARDWYLAIGYRVRRETWFVQAPLGPDACAPAPALELDPNALAAALAQEERDGFSKVEGMIGAGHVTVGLIAGRMLKLLVREGVSQAQTIASIGAAFHRTRQRLIIAPAAELPAPTPGLIVDKVLLVVKPLETAGRSDPG